MKHLIRLACAWLVFAAYNAVEADIELETKARELAVRHAIVDTHIDVPYRVHEEWVDVTQATSDGDFDFPRALRGGLNIAFMSIYTPARLEAEGGSRQLAHELIDGVEAMVTRAPTRFMMVRSVGDAEAAVKQGRIGLALGMENGSPIEGNLDNLAGFTRRGVRYITLTHSLSNHISDSSYDENKQWNGLSDFGRELVREMNRTGVMIDISHVSDEAFWQVLEISQAPVIASHSSARHFTPGFERNMSDEMIKALAKNGGVIPVNFGSSFVTAEANEFMVDLGEQRSAFLEEHGFEENGPEAREFRAQFLKDNPFPFAGLGEVVDHFDHVIGLVGPDHVGIGSDFDGVGDSLPEVSRTSVPTPTWWPNSFAGITVSRTSPRSSEET